MVSNSQQVKSRAPGARRPWHKPHDAAPGTGATGLQPQPHQNHKVINRQITSAAEAGDSNRLFEKIQLHLHDMNGINMATAFHRVAKLVSGGVLYLEATRQHPTFQELFAAIVQHITCHSLRNSDKAQACSSEATWEMPVQCMSIVNWSCATLQIRNKALCIAIAEISAPRLNEFKPYELSNLMWAFAKLSFSPCDLFKNVTTRLLHRTEGEFKVQCLSTIAWSFATMKRRILVVFSSLAKELVQHAHEMKPQEISNALWAFAKSRCANVELFQALGDAAAMDSVIWSFKPQELSNTAWAFATVGLQHPALFALIEKVSIRKRHEMVPQNIANILWSFAKLQVEPQLDLYPLLLEAAERTLPQHKPQELSAVVWAAAQACPHGHSGFFAAAARCCAARLQDTQEFSMNGLANLVKAFAVVDMNAPEIFVSLVRASLPLLPQCKPLALCGLFSGTIRAASNLSSSSHSAELTNAVSRIAERMTSQMHKIQPFELQELSEALAASRLGIEVESLYELRQEVERARSRLPDNGEAKDMHKGPHSVGSMSTSAEESQGEDEDDDFTSWATGYHQHVAPDESRVKLEKSSAGAASALSTAGCWDAKTKSIGLPPGLVTYEQPASSCAAWGEPAEGWTPWRVPLFGANAEEQATSAAPVEAGAPKRSSSSGPSAPKKVAVKANERGYSSMPPLSTAAGNGESSKFGTKQLTSLEPGVFGEVSADLAVMEVDSAVLAEKGTTYGVEERVFRLSSGCPQERVVFKRVHAGLRLPESVTVHSMVLQPTAQVNSAGCCFLVYPHCAHGNLAEWLARRSASGATVKPAEAALIVRDVLTAAEALLERASSAVSAVQPDEIMMSEGDVPRVREPLPGKPGGWQDALKWLSPDEAVGRMQCTYSTWPALAYRLGMLLYCMGTGSEDPYPGATGEAVLMSLLSEVCGGAPRMRPNMVAYRGPEILRRMVAACLQIDGQSPPARPTLVAVLDAIAREAQQHEPMKVSTASLAA